LNQLVERTPIEFVQVDFQSRVSPQNAEGAAREAATEFEEQAGSLLRSIGVGIGCTQSERICGESEPRTE